MAFTLTFWLNRLLLTAVGAVPIPPPSDRTPMEIQVERLPDYLWRDLGFLQPRRPEGGVKRFTRPAPPTPQVSWHRQGD